MSAPTTSPETIAVPAQLASDGEPRPQTPAEYLETAYDRIVATTAFFGTAYDKACSLERFDWYRANLQTARELAWFAASSPAERASLLDMLAAFADSIASQIPEGHGLPPNEDLLRALDDGVTKAIRKANQLGWQRKD